MLFLGALADFDKLSVPNAEQDNAANTSDSQKQTDKCETSEKNEKDWTEDFFKQTIDQMDKNLQNFAETLKNGEITKFGKNIDVLLQESITR